MQAKLSRGGVVTDKRDAVPALTLEATARAVGGYVWLNRELFEVVGGWVADTSDARAQLLFGQHCYQLAWHAELFAARLPRLREFTSSEFISPPTETAPALMNAIRATAGDVARLSVAYRLLFPRLAGRYTAHRGQTSPVADGALIRALGLALTDVTNAWHEGEFLLQALGSSDGGDASQQVAQFETTASSLFVRLAE
jgi:hypothetical protein